MTVWRVYEVLCCWQASRPYPPTLRELARLAAGTDARLAMLRGDEIDPWEEWGGMPEFEQEDLSAAYSIKINFQTLEDRESFAQFVGQSITDNTKSLWFPAMKKTNLKGVAFDES